MKKTLLSVLVLLAVVAGCTDAESARWSSRGNKHTVVLYSGGKEVGRWTSTGTPRSVADEDGWQFVDADTKKLTYVTGTVVIVTEDK